MTRIDDEWAECHHCHHKYKAHDDNNGTFGLQKHLNRCLKNPNRKKEKGQPSLLMPPPKPCQDDEIPFRKVEGSGFVAMMQEAQPRFKVPGRMTIYRDMLKMYVEEKNNLKTYFLTSKKRVSLTTDTWTSPNNFNYICVTAHYIDQNWKLQKRILMFCQVEGHTGNAIGEKLVDCLKYWGLKDIFGVTLDNVRCSAHVLALVIKDAVQLFNESVKRIRSVVKYVLGSPSRYEKFKQCASLAKIDKNFQERFIFEQNKEFVLPSDADIEKTISSDDIVEEVLIEFRENVASDPFIARMSHLMFSKYNKYWGVYDKMNYVMFFAQLLDPREKLKGLEFTLNCLFENNSWEVQRIMRKVKLEFQELFDDYRSVYSTHEEGSSSAAPVVASSVSTQYQGLKSRIQSMKRQHWDNPSCVEEARTRELDRYLKDVMDGKMREVDQDDDFDILSWWQANANMYKVLSYMARDILSMHVSSVSSESAFSTGKRVLAPWRAFMSTTKVEALLCTQSYLQKHIALDLLFIIENLL
ncbi:zinc finger BED domain-containing protein RICESLEEPER 2-like [Papaver somniferum]|uniref:zinc finger BED domain-containing protein RICESLEEPER 2-like n=1 Tax=Papaver somniferum TaxID=3469 RepID=UPI000E6FD60C|nr:zinc finger BED domain-containing protein RICESLEEPER 2-like [Papaver somniferum]